MGILPKSSEAIRHANVNNVLQIFYQVVDFLAAEGQVKRQWVTHVKRVISNGQQTLEFLFPGWLVTLLRFNETLVCRIVR